MFANPAKNISFRLISAISSDTDFIALKLLPNHLDEHPLPPLPVKLIIKNMLPRAQMQFAISNGNHHFAAHDLAFVVGVGVVLSGAVVEVATLFGITARVKRHEFFEPAFVIGV